MKLSKVALLNIPRKRGYFIQNKSQLNYFWPLAIG